MDAVYVNEKSIFVAARELADADERAKYLDSACRNDAVLRRKVEQLLRHDREDPDFLNAPVEGCGPARPVSEVGEKPGDTIGPYRLLEEIGEGGFAVVYMAEQVGDLRRKVALKIIRPGMDSRQVIARFEAERQALALMDHPHIARVFDAGATSLGRPYFVMELVRGLPITRYCDEHRLTLHERLELFVTVCRAVQHAHQKGIVHRDIKPSNVLVARHDDRPNVKVIDFGIAKAIGTQLTDKSLHTGFFHALGTPLYMSPEQAGMEPDIDTRSDIYSLGVLLYEMLTGATPFVQSDREQPAYHEIVQSIREVEPQKPSTRLSTLGNALPTVSALRSTEPQTLRRFVRGDLDWVVMKALSKDRERRYETASGFAADVLHHLAGKPVAARPPTAAYRLSKFTRRHRRMIVAAALVTAASFVAAVAIVFSIVNSYRHAALIAEQQTKAAEEKTNAANTLERESRRDSMMQQLQRQLLSEHVAGWSDESWALVGKIAKLRPNDELRDAAAASLLGIDASPSKKIDFQPAELAYDPSGTRLLMTQFVPEDPEKPERSGRREIARVWNATTDEFHDLPQRLHDGYGPITYRPNGTPLQLVWNKEEGNVVLVWDMIGQKAVRRLEYPFAQELAPVAWSFPHGGTFAGTLVVDAEGNRQAVVWQTESGALLVRFPTMATHLEASPDGEFVATAAANGVVEIWSVPQRKRIATLASGHTSILCMAWARDYLRAAGTSETGWLLAVGASGGDLTIWDVRAKIPRSYCSGSAYDVNRLIFSPDGMTLASVGRNWPMLWDVATGRLVLRLGPTNSMTCAAFSPDGKTLAIGSEAVFGFPGGVDVWNLHETRGQQVLRGLRAPISQVWFSPDDRLVGALAQNWQLAIWNLTTGRLLHVFETPKGQYAESAALAFDSDERRVAFASGTGAKIWDVNTGSELRSVELPSGFIDRMAFDGADCLSLIRQESVDSRFLPFGPNAKPEETPRVCRIRDLLGAHPPQPVLEIKDFPKTVVGILLTPDGKRAVIEGIESEGGRPKRAIKMFELPGGTERWALRSEFVRDDHRIRSLDTTGRFLLTFDAMLSTYLLINVESGKQVRAFKHTPSSLGPSAKICVASLHESSNRASNRCLVQGDDETFVLTLERKLIVSEAVPFSSDGNQIAWGNADGTVTLLDMKRVHGRLMEVGLEWEEGS